MYGRGLQAFLLLGAELWNVGMKSQKQEGVAVGDASSEIARGERYPSYFSYHRMKETNTPGRTGIGHPRAIATKRRRKGEKRATTKDLAKQCRAQ